MCKELKIIEEKIEYKQIKSNDLRLIAGRDPAFKRKTRLDDLIKSLNTKYKMNIKVVYLPKFHCECNPIEMFWAMQKNDFRKHNNQESIIELLKERIINSRESYMQKDSNHRLWSRLWRVILDYNSGRTY